MRILVVEDDRHVAGAVRRGLQEHGYAVDVAVNGVEGHWLATENTYDVLILDSMLPRMSGEDLCAALRESGDWTPILMLTARSGADEEAQALDAGADDFLSKPFSYQVLVARLRALVLRGGTEKPVLMASSDLCVTLVAQGVPRGEEEIPVGP